MNYVKLLEDRNSELELLISDLLKQNDSLKQQKKYYQLRDGTNIYLRVYIYFRDLKKVTDDVYHKSLYFKRLDTQNDLIEFEWQRKTYDLHRSSDESAKFAVDSKFFGLLLNDKRIACMNIVVDRLSISNQYIDFWLSKYKRKWIFEGSGGQYISNSQSFTPKQITDYIMRNAYKHFYK